MTLNAPAEATGDTTQIEARARGLFAAYERALRRAERYRNRGRLDAAAAYGAIAAHLALRPHSGFYAAPRLERMLVDIGRRTRGESSHRRVQYPARRLQSVLHVVSELMPVGGLTNMLQRWIDADDTRTHSVAITRHYGPVYQSVLDVVASRGGSVTRIDHVVGGLTARARALTDLAREHDAVVLHVHSQDVTPTLAFCDPQTTPPVILLNHGDHLFWLGVSTSDVVINLRDAATDLSVARRGIEPQRNVMAPTIVAPAVRTKSREEAKRALGLAPDTLLLFSAARGMKYRSVGGRSFADTHVDLLKRHPSTVLWVLGAGDPEDWRAAAAAAGGRIVGFEESPDTKTFFEAADIYVDSFPFVSSTSMMEAAGLGTPLVSRFYGPNEARIFAINHPGIDAPTLNGASEHDYISQLERLILDPDLRAAKGEEARLAVLHYHTPPSWLAFAEEAFKRAAELAPINPDKAFAPEAKETFSFGEPDRRMYEVFGIQDGDADEMVKSYLGLMPLPQRFAAWRDLMKRGKMQDPVEAVRLLTPEWIIRRIRDR